jgi:hypothetical protein
MKALRHYPRILAIVLSASAVAVLATVVATPCTAPLMGAAIGFALSQNAFITFAVVTACDPCHCRVDIGALTCTQVGIHRGNPCRGSGFCGAAECGPFRQLAMAALYERISSSSAESGQAHLR